MLGSLRLVPSRDAQRREEADYWDVDAIIASDDRVRVVMRTEAAALGYLAGGSGVRRFESKAR